MYPYSEGDRLGDRNTYFYSAFHGEAFLPAWAESRARARQSWVESVSEAQLATASSSATRTGSRPAQGLVAPSRTGEVNTDAALAFVLGGIRRGSQIVDAEPEPFEWMHLLIQRFEVSKRIHERYTWKPAGLRAVSGADYRCLDRYVSFAECLVAAASALSTLQPLNALLKVMDTLVATRAITPPHLCARCVDLIDSERRLVEELGKSTGVAW